MIPALRLTRDLVDRLPERVDERGPARLPPPPQAYYDQTSAQVLAALPRPDELWVFAAGSLIWKPRFPVVDRRPARIRGWQRRFCLGPDQRFRGSPAAPGMMMSLDRGGECAGFALRMDGGDIAGSLDALLKVEPPVPPRWVEAETELGVVHAIAFTAAPDFVMYRPEPPEEELADTLATAVGFLGSMADYLLNTVSHLEEAGVHDPHLWRMQDLVADRLERLPPR
jgi:cation transport protein ChaC